jgi:hypothetical protein
MISGFFHSCVLYGGRQLYFTPLLMSPTEIGMPKVCVSERLENELTLFIPTVGVVDFISFVTCGYQLGKESLYCLNRKKGPRPLV